MLAFNSSAARAYNNLISGTGSVIQRGTGTMTLAGNNTYTGATNVEGGACASMAISPPRPASVTVAKRRDARRQRRAIARRSPRLPMAGILLRATAPARSTMGSLTLNSGSVLDFELGQANTAGGLYNDLINVNGDLTLDGTLNVSLSDGGTYGAGLYRLINYTGALTDNGLDLGLMPASSPNYVQTSIAMRINLINSAGPCAELLRTARPPPAMRRTAHQWQRGHLAGRRHQ